MPKYIFVTGGGLSGLGKGIAAASIGHLLSYKYKVSPIKCDGYLNTDPGTMNPIEHGEVFVLDDGLEVDMDFGHYERFMNCTCTKNASLTMGKIFEGVRKKERRGDYLGKTVQYIPHVTGFIKDQWKKVANESSAEILLIEIGGTVGDMENELYVEAARQMAYEKEDVLFVHLTYIPIPEHVSEQKTKIAQNDLRSLRERGIVPDIIIARCKEALDESSKRKISLFTNVPEEAIFSGNNVDSVYKLPQMYYEQGMLDFVIKKLGLEPFQPKLRWPFFIRNMENCAKEIRIGICGKYTSLEDSYASINEALKHCAAHEGVCVNFNMVDTERTTDISSYDGIIVPGGFGDRGIDGKISCITYARKNNVPFLGICLGLQLAVIEYAKNICGVPVTSEEFHPDAINKIIAYLPGQTDSTEKGGTMRLGSYEALVRRGTKIYDLYQSNSVFERHRHRYEVNPSYHSILEQHGLTLAGFSPDGSLVEFISLENHPYFVGTQAHPELKSKLEKPAPLFLGLVQAAIKKKYG